MKVKIIGAGSIGNHLAHAARRMGWSVVIVDSDPDALRRTREEIYPQRYGSWDPSIELVTSDKQPRGGFDLICIGTPPGVRMKLALEALAEKPRLLQLEKPLCDPTLKGLDLFKKALLKSKTKVIVGYDHALSKSIGFVKELILSSGEAGKAITLDVEFREYWGGIFKAHPWLKGPHDSYLGFIMRGGGAACEHSHALHLWYVISEWSGLGNWQSCAYSMDTKKGKAGSIYDALTTFSFVTNKGNVGRVVQDVVTSPPRKWFRLQCENGYLEWHCNVPNKGDVVRWKFGNNSEQEKCFPKSRPDDFYQEMLHIDDLISGRAKIKNSPVNLKSGEEVMKVLAGALRIFKSGKQIGTVNF